MEETKSPSLLQQSNVHTNGCLSSLHFQMERLENELVGCNLAYLHFVLVYRHKLKPHPRSYQLRLCNTKEK